MAAMTYRLTYMQHLPAAYAALSDN